jgi:hypothetical protein
MRYSVALTTTGKQRKLGSTEWTRESRRRHWRNGFTVHSGELRYKGTLVSEEHPAQLSTSPRHSPGLMRARLLRGLDLTLAATAVVLSLSLLVAGWRDVSQGFDVWYYHLPFAGRIAGIVDAQAYAFSGENQARFDGFPLLGELLQGAMWRLTGHIEASSFVSLAALFALPIFLWRLFAVPAHLSLLAFVAVPLVHIHATASYVDLPANACATMLLLCVYRALVTRRTSPRFLAASAALAAATANMKFQLVPIVALATLTLVVLALRQLTAWSSSSHSDRSALLHRAGVCVIALPLVFATPLKNTIVHGNPVWPVKLAVAGHAFPHLEEAYDQSPPHLAGSPRPIRFLRSVLEIDNFPIVSQRRWSLDQWAPPDDPSCRMGGYFGAYVVANLAALGFIVWRRRTREPIAAAALVAGVTVVASLVPQSHELRYYMHWMLLLVCANLVLWSREGALARAGLGMTAAAALAVVVWSTNAGYLYASGSTFPQFLAKRAEQSVIDTALPGERLCIARQPFTFLYAPVFHARNDYAVQERAAEADCKDARRVP